MTSMPVQTCPTPSSASTTVQPPVEPLPAPAASSAARLTPSRASAVPPVPVWTPVARNAVVTYTIDVFNDGSDPVHDITLWDTPPVGSRFIDAVDTMPGPDAFICAAPNPSGVLVCSGGSLSGTVNKASNSAGILPT